MTASLDNKILAITRKDPDAQEFIQLVSSEGGKTISLPVIDIEPKNPKVVDEFINTVKEKRCDYCAFMSSQAVEVLFNLARRINKTGEIISALNSRTIVAIGPRTRLSLIRHGIDVKIVPEKSLVRRTDRAFLKDGFCKRKKYHYS